MIEQYTKFMSFKTHSSKTTTCTLFSSIYGSIRIVVSSRMFYSKSKHVAFQAQKLRFLNIVVVWITQILHVIIPRCLNPYRTNVENRVSS